VDWKELRRLKGPQELTMDKVLRKLRARKKDPWEKMLKLRQKIGILKPTRGRGKSAA
jgi:bifunctional non-homologous end joining protein LigD